MPLLDQVDHSAGCASRQDIQSDLGLGVFALASANGFQAAHKRRPDVIGGRMPPVHQVYSEALCCSVLAEVCRKRSLAVGDPIADVLGEPSLSYKRRLEPDDSK